MRTKRIKDQLDRHVRFDVDDDEIEDWEPSYLGHKGEDVNEQ